MSKKILLYIQTALPCEAKPLIEKYRLKQILSTPFSVYEGSEVLLGISGIGNLAAASCAAFLTGRFPSPAAWLNIGVGGHKTHEVGEVFLAHKVSSDQYAFYPSFVFSHQMKTCEIKSVFHPENQYPEDVIYEMEAFGFYSAAVKFATQEMIHSIKVISDNKTSPSHQLNKPFVEKLIRDQLEEISPFIDKLMELQKEVATIYYEEDLTPYTNRWHFTSTEKEQLKSLLRKWKACKKDEVIQTEGFTSAKKFLEAVRHAF